MAVGGKGYRTRPTIWQPIWRISELKKSRQTSGNIRCQISWDKRKHTPVFARPARFPQHCVCARLNSGYTLQLCAGLSLPSHYLRHECYPRITHWPETGQKLLPKALSAFSVSEILIINCCFPIISSFRTASGYKGGWADGRKEHRSSGLPKLSGLSTWIPLLQDGSCAPRCPSHLWIPLMNVRAHICLCFPEFTPRFEDGRLGDSSDAVIQQGEMKPFCT